MRAGRIPELPFPGVPGIVSTPTIPPSPLPPGRPPPKSLPDALPSQATPDAVSQGGGAHLISVVQGARAGLLSGPAGPRLQAALRRGEGLGLTSRPPIALRPMALGPGPAQSVPAPFPRLCSRRWRPAGECALASTRAPRTRTWRADREGCTGIHPGPAPEVTGTRPRVAPGHTRGPGRLRPSAQLSGPAAAHSPWHRHARPRTPWRPGILHCTGARCCCCCANRHSAAS